MKASITATSNFEHKSTKQNKCNNLNGSIIGSIIFVHFWATVFMPGLISVLNIAHLLLAIF